MSVENKPAFTLKLLHPKFWITWVLLFIFFLLSLLPIFVLDFIGKKLGNIYAATNKKRYGYVKVNLSLCFSDKSEKEIDVMCIQYFRAFMRSMMHFGKIWWSPKFRLQQFIQQEGFDCLDELKQKQQNIIILTCHSVGLEFAVTALSSMYECSGPYKPMKNALIDWMVAKGRTRFGVKVFTREDGLRPLIKYTRKGLVTIYLADEDLGVDRTVFAPFFGVQKATIPVLGRLAKSADAQVVPCYSYYDEAKRKYIVRLLPPIADFPTDDTENDVIKMNQCIEEMIMLCPEQYLWTLRYFKTRPEGEAAVYKTV